MKLSATMQDVVAKMRAAGGRIERWDGGFWTTPGMTYRERLTPTLGACGSYRVPDWYVGTQTVQALQKRGLIVVSKLQPIRGFVIEYRLTS